MTTELSTTGAAAALYERAVHLLARGEDGAVDLLRRALAVDDHFALGHAALAFAFAAAGDQGAARDEADRAAGLTRRVSRRERQHVEIVAAAVAGDLGRAHALAREHLLEHPDDLLVRHAVRAAAEPRPEK